MPDIDSAGLSRRGDGLLELLVFDIAGDQFAIDLRAAPDARPVRPASSARRALDPRDLSRVVDLRARLGFPPSTGEQRLVIVQADGQPIGILVDRISEVLQLSDEMVVPAPAAAGIDTSLLAGAAPLDDRLVLILSARALEAAGPASPDSLAA